MVVLLILAIVRAVAIPTFLGTSESAKDRGGQRNLNTAAGDSHTVFFQSLASLAEAVDGARRPPLECVTFAADRDAPVQEVLGELRRELEPIGL